MFVHIIKNNFHSSLDIIQFLLICSARLFIYSFRSFFSFIRSHHKVLLLLLPTEWVSGDLCWTNDHHSARRQVIGQLSQMHWGARGAGIGLEGALRSRMGAGSHWEGRSRNRREYPWDSKPPGSWPHLLAVPVSANRTSAGTTEWLESEKLSNYFI